MNRRLKNKINADKPPLMNTSIYIIASVFAAYTLWHSLRPELNWVAVCIFAAATLSQLLAAMLRIGSYGRMHIVYSSGGAALIVATLINPSTAQMLYIGTAILFITSFLYRSVIPAIYTSVAVLVLAAIMVASLMDAYLVVTVIVTALVVKIALNKSQQGLYLQSRTDPLTGLPNRLALMEELHAHIGQANEHSSLALLFLDLNSFKEINDSAGHLVGDLLLKAVSKRLLSIMGEHKKLARFGGDEFVILIKNPGNADDIESLMRSIAAAIEVPFVIEDQHYCISACLGLATYPFDAKDTDSLIDISDKAMLSAKRSCKPISQH